MSLFQSFHVLGTIVTVADFSAGALSARWVGQMGLGFFLSVTAALAAGFAAARPDLQLQEPLSRILQSCPVVAVAAIGLKTLITGILKLGRGAVLVPMGATLILLVFVLTSQLLTT